MLSRPRNWSSYDVECDLGQVSKTVYDLISTRAEMLFPDTGTEMEADDNSDTYAHKCTYIVLKNLLDVATNTGNDKILE